MVTRRRFLQKGAIVGVGATTVLAGCSDQLGGLGGGGGDVASWTVEPGAIGEDSYATVYTEPSSVSNSKEDLPSGLWDSYVATYVDRHGFVTLLPNEVDAVVVPDSGLLSSGYDVVTGSFDPARVTDGLERNGYGLDREHGSFDLFTPESGDQVVGVDDGTIVTAGDGSVVEAVIDAASGDGGGGGGGGDDGNQTSGNETDAGTDAPGGDGDWGTYAAADDDVARLQDEIGSGGLAYLSPMEPAEETDVGSGTFAGQVGYAQDVDVSGARSNVDLALLFESEGDVAASDVEEWTGSADRFDQWLEIEVSTDGRVATVSGSVRTRDVASEWEG